MSGIFYKGTPIEELTKEELIKVIEELDYIIRKMREDHIKALDSLCGVS